MQEPEIIEAALSEMTTLLIQSAETIDFSRLTLVKQSVELEGQGGSNLSKFGSLAAPEPTPLGALHKIRVEFKDQDQALRACVAFEVLERKRGLKRESLNGIVNR